MDELGMEREQIRDPRKVVSCLIGDELAGVETLDGRVGTTAMGTN